MSNSPPPRWQPIMPATRPSYVTGAHIRLISSGVWVRGGFKPLTLWDLTAKHPTGLENYQSAWKTWLEALLPLVWKCNMILLFSYYESDCRLVYWMTCLCIFRKTKRRSLHTQGHCCTPRLSDGQETNRCMRTRSCSLAPYSPNWQWHPSIHVHVQS